MPDRATPTPTSVALNDAVRAAQNLPQLITTVQNIDPGLAKVLEGGALVNSKTPWGTLATAVVAYLASRYGLGWDEQTCALVAGVGVLVGSYAMRWFSPGRITGIFTRAPTSSVTVTRV